MPTTVAPNASESLPLAPPVNRAARNRWIALPFFLGSVVILGLAVFLSPGYGLHQAFGYPTCGFKLGSGLPCVSCGMTTAFSYAAEGDLIGAFRVQPAGAFLALFVAVFAIVSGYALASGMSLAPIGKAIWRPRVIVPLIALLIGSWVYTLIFTLLTGASPA